MLAGRSAGSQPDAIAPDAHRWTLLQYHLPGGTAGATSRHKVAIWRELGRIGALSLKHGRWAVGHGEGGGADVDAVAELVADAGGECESREMDIGAEPATEQLLLDVCNRLWDGFFNDLDRLAGDASISNGLVPVPAVDELRRAYLTARRRDLVESDAARRARRRLEECYAHVDLEPLGSGAATRRWLKEACPSPAFESPVQSWARRDGQCTYLLCVDPSPSLTWERAFTAFEESVYQGVTNPVNLEHGAFTFVAAADELTAITDRLTRRLRHFQLSLV